MFKVFNFYYYFIYGFDQLATILIELIKKN